MSSATRNSCPDVHQVHAAIQGFIFLGTRHRGVFDRSVTFTPWLLSIIASWVYPKSALPQILSQASSFLNQYRRINVEFKEEGGENFPMACFYETSPTTGIVRPFDLLLVLYRSNLRNKGYNCLSNRFDFELSLG